MIATQPLDNYWRWCRARGQFLADDACPFCAFRPQGQSALRVCAYSLSADELRLLHRVVPALRPFQSARLFSCPASAGQLCALQRQDLCQVQTVILLGNISAQIVSGARNFARQQGRPYRVAGWEGVTFVLTFHPADLLRYPPALQLWRQDLQQAGCSVKHDV